MQKRVYHKSEKVKTHIASITHLSPESVIIELGVKDAFPGGVLLHALTIALDGIHGGIVEVTGSGPCSPLHAVVGEHPAHQHNHYNISTINEILLWWQTTMTAPHNM